MEIIKNPKAYGSAFVNFLQRELFFTWIFWGLYEIIRDLNYTQDQKEQIWPKVSSAFISAGLAALLTFPYDIAQTNIIAFEQ